MTEDEAKTKWCPMVRYQDLRATNRDACYGTHCIGSECMMWRWQAMIEPPMKFQKQYATATGFIYEMTGIPQGYCGLAGKP